jgi:hypothetical protein
VPFNASISEALSHAPQVGSLTSTTTPTTTQGAFLWNRAFDFIRTQLKIAGVSSSFTASSVGEGRVLEAKGSVGVRAQGVRAAGQGDTTAQRLIDAAMDMIDQLHKDRQLRRVLIADGAVDNLPASPFGNSDWTDGKDPDYSETWGGDNVAYIPGPVIQDAEPL